MIPSIDINLKNGALGGIADNSDAVAGLVIGCDPAASTMSAGDIKVLYSVDDAINASFDLIPYAFQQIKEFYAEAGTGAKLYVLVVADTVTLTNIADKANAYAKKLLDEAGGEINLLGICRKPAAGYTATTTKGMDDDSIAAVTKMQALAEDFFAAFNPFVGIVEGRAYEGVASDLDDLGEGSANYVGVAICTSDELNTLDASAASVGLVLGRASAVPVQRKIARVKDGGLAITGAYLGTTKVEAADWTSVATKGYITIGQYPNKTGFYFIDDTLATVQTEDYKTISMRRTMNKMVRIVYATYVEELNDDIELTAAGKLTPATAKYYQGKIENAINASMTADGELSAFSAFVDMNQNVLSTGELKVVCSATPKGYSQKIVVDLGFSVAN